MLVNADFHVHSCFSSASSKDMLIENMAPKSKLKGLKLLGTGDAFHPGWLDIIEDSTTYSGDGIYTNGDTDFVLTTEVEGKNRIHHLIIIPDMEIARELSEKLVSKNKNSDGRPRTAYTGAELLDMVREYDCLIGPAHAFTPWTGMYKSYDSIYDCYEKKPDFVELGLSADTDMADTVGELKDFPFLTNSDAHSPWPHRLGREFNVLELEDISYSSIKDAIKHKIAYVTEDRKGNGLILSNPIKVNTTLANLKAVSTRFAIDKDKEYAAAVEINKKLKTKCPSVEQNVGNLSGGNQQKVLLAKWMFAEPDILILDEPTRGIDVGAKYEIYCIINQLVADGKSVIMISSELPEILGMCDRIYVMSEGKMVGELSGAEATQEKIMAQILSSERKGE